MIRQFVAKIPYNTIILFVLLVCTLHSKFAIAEDNTNLEPTLRRWKIGLALPLSGGVNWLGDNILRGAKMYLADFPNPLIELVIEDVTTDNLGRGVAAVKKLIATETPNALIIGLSPTANAVVADLEMRQIPTIAIIGADVAKKKQYMVKLWPTASGEAQLIIQAIKERKISKLAIVTTEQDSMIARRDALSKLLLEQSVRYFQVSTGEELSTYANVIAQNNPEAVVMLLMPGQNAILARRLRELKYPGLFIGTVAIAEESERKLAQGSLSGAIAVDSLAADWFTEKYRRAFNTSPPTGVANGYDAMKMIVEAITQIGPDGSAYDLNARIRREDFSGALGNYSFVADEYNAYDVPLKVKEID